MSLSKQLAPCLLVRSVTILNVYKEREHLIGSGTFLWWLALQGVSLGKLLTP